MRSSRADDDIQRLRKTLARDLVWRMSVFQSVDGFQNGLDN